MVTKPTRQEIAAISGGNPRLMRAFERLFEQLNVTESDFLDQGEELQGQSALIAQNLVNIQSLSTQTAGLSSDISGLQDDVVELKRRERGSVTLDAQGEATILFVEPVDVALVSQVQLTAWVPSGDPIVVNAVSWVEVNGLRTGVNIKAGRLRELPGVLSSLLGFRVWDNPSAAGATVDWMLN